MPHSQMLALVLGTLATIGSAGKTALLLIDVQDCFLNASTTNGKPGSLSVPASHIIPLINSIRNQKGCLFDKVIRTQDFHPAKHISFGSTHGLAAFAHLGGKGGLPLRCLKPTTGNTADASCCPAYHINKGSQNCSAVLCPPAGWNYTVNSSGIVTGNTACTECKSNPAGCMDDKQAMWTDHCVQTGDSTFPPSLVKNAKDIIVKKGSNLYVDAYSGFMDNTQNLMTKLDAMLKKEGVDTLYVAGIATDVCVHATVRDAFHNKTGTYTVKVIKDATAAVQGNKANYDKAIKEMMGFGATIITTADVLNMACPTAAATTTAATTVPQQVVKGSVNFEVALPSGVTQAQFLNDTQVKTGVQKGIAAKLGVNHTWVAVTLTAARRLSASRALANATNATKANIKVDFTVTVPAGTTGPTSAATLKTALKGSTANSETEKTAWANNVVTEIKKASPTTYATVTATTKTVAHVATTTTKAPATKAPAGGDTKVSSAGAGGLSAMVMALAGAQIAVVSMM